VTVAEPILPGDVEVRDVSQRFLRNPGVVRSLKRTIVRREVDRREWFWALRDVSLRARPGEAIGVIGQNGSGKSTLLKLLAGVFRPTSGAITIGGSISSLLELGAGFHPEFTGRENVFLNGAIFGLSRAYMAEHMDEIVDFAELAQFIDQPVRTYSSGMYMRLGFSVAMHVNPDVLLLDEVLAVGDETFSKKCYGRIFDFKRTARTIIFVSHDLNSVEMLCDRAVLLDRGRVESEGVVQDVVRAYHRRLARRQVSARTARIADHVGRPARFVDAGIVNNAGEDTDVILEGHRVVFWAALMPESTEPQARVAFIFRDAAGKLIAGRSGVVDLVGGEVNQVQLDVGVVPFREGRFMVDVVATSEDGSRELARIEHALGFTVLSDDADGAGPVRIHATWGVVRRPAEGGARDAAAGGLTGGSLS
jgi:ABC-type polysaccharide/polyol phosphate transport system ATPase subunit